MRSDGHGEGLPGPVHTDEMRQNADRPTHDELAEVVQDAWLSRASRRRGSAWLRSKRLPLETGTFDQEEPSGQK